MRRPLVPALATAAFALFAVLHALDRPLYAAILDAIHVHPFPRPFLDTRFVTAQVECWRRGIDVYARNPCDPLGRTLDYSPLWLRLPFLGRADDWTPVFGLAVDGAFLLALFGMPWPSDGPFCLVVATGAVLSWATVFAAERGNTDLLMFAGAVLFARLLTQSAPWRGVGYALVLCAGLLKFYPLALLALAVREPRRIAWRVGLLGALALSAFVARFDAELTRIGANMASSPFGDMFGARSLPFGVPLLFGRTPIRDASGVYVAAGALGPAMTAWAWAVCAAISAACVLAAILRGRDPALREMLGRLPPAARSLLLVGAVLCAGCFFGHQNIGYRAVLLLLVLPGLLALARVAPGRRARLVIRSTGLLIVLVLWDGVVSRSISGWFVMQGAWWWIVTVLLTIAVGLLGPDMSEQNVIRRRRASARA